MLALRSSGGGCGAVHSSCSCGKSLLRFAGWLIKSGCNVAVWLRELVIHNLFVTCSVAMHIYYLRFLGYHWE